MKPISLRDRLPVLILLVTALVFGVIVVFSVLEVRTAPTTAGFTRPQSDDPYNVYLTLTLTGFDAVTRTASGSVHVEVYRGENVTGAVMPLGKANFDLLHDRPSTSSDAGETLIVGGSDAPIDLSGMARVPGGKFTWQAQDQVSSFFYPFDSYVLDLNPTFGALTDSPGVTLDVPVDTATVHSEISAMRMGIRLFDLRDPAVDPAQITLERPLMIRAVALIIGLLAVIWLAYLLLLQDTSAFAGSVIAFFVGVIGLRGTLMAGVSVFPVLIDYLVLGVSILAVGVMLARWTSTLVGPPARKCPYCKQTIAAEATRCPHCTSALEPSSPN